MALSDLIPGVAAASASEQKAAAVLRVHLHALLRGCAVDSLAAADIRAFLTRWRQNIERAAPVRAMFSRWLRVSLLSFRELLVLYKNSLDESSYFRSGRRCNPRMAKLEPWSFQTDKALEFWFDAVRLAPAGKWGSRLSPTDIKRIEQAFHSRVGLRPNAVVGRPGSTLWVTYAIERGERQIGSATRLRDALGLYDRGANEYAFLVRLGTAMESMGPVHAPTAFDACAYPRFRPWPPATNARDSDAGRTFDLDPAQRSAGPDHGRPEMVAAPRSFASCVDLVGIGYIGADADSTARSFVGFADEVCPGTTVRSLIVELQAI